MSDIFEIEPTAQDWIQAQEWGRQRDLGDLMVVPKARIERLERILTMLQASVSVAMHNGDVGNEICRFFLDQGIEAADLYWRWRAENKMPAPHPDLAPMEQKR